MDDKTLLTLVEKFGSSDLAELVLNDGSLNLVLRKAGAIGTSNSHGTVQGAPVAHSAASVHLGLHADTRGADTRGADSHISGSTSYTGGKVAAKASNTEAITSPIVATFYKSPGPDTPSFAEVGKKIKAGETLCILEAMKMMNHLEAEYDCEIVEIKVSNGDLVEYGQTLFEVKRT